MQFINTNSMMLLAVIARYSVPTQACQCVDQDTGLVNYAPYTAACCGAYKGTFIVDGADRDCNAHSIRNNMSGFDECCMVFGFKSDCHCPSGCSDKLEEGGNATSVQGINNATTLRPANVTAE